MEQQYSLFDEAQSPPPWEMSEAVLLADVVFNLPVEGPFSYLIPDSVRGILQPGCRVEAPLGAGNKRQVGYCVALRAHKADAPGRWKSLSKVLDESPLLSGRMLELTRWIADYYLCSWGQVLESVVPSGVRHYAGTHLVSLCLLTENAQQLANSLELTPKQRRAFEWILGATEPPRLDEVQEGAECGVLPIRALADKGLIEIIKQRVGRERIGRPAQAKTPDLKLNPEQKRVLETIRKTLESRTPKTFLLRGVTGSGKTEVYIQAIREVVGYGKQAIVLVPEISLTPQTIRRFESRFENVAVLHSRLSDGERHSEWARISSGIVQVVVGARSAVFAPTPQLGLIVIDEEHESTFKQDNVPRYHAREVAWKRCQIEGVPLILGSATPSLESWARAHSGVYERLDLPNRVAGRPLPPVTIVDTRTDPDLGAGAALGRPMQMAIARALNEKGQIILFQNLRGHSPVIWCRACGKGVQCPECDITLNWHKSQNIALCHGCDFRIPPPSNCPNCGNPGIRYLGTGTQKLEIEVQKRFPKARVIRMDSDTMRQSISYEEALDRFREGGAEILLGTQMIAKGLDFPNVTLVGVIDADIMLHQADLRSSERTFQLIAQVAGRTGRGERGGKVLVQSACPDDRAISLAARHDYVQFARGELEFRKIHQSPPYTHLLRVILRSPDEASVQHQARLVAELIRAQVGKDVLQNHLEPIRVLGPAPAPVSKLQGRFRYHLQLAAQHSSSLQRCWKLVVELWTPSRDLEFAVDVDPLNMR